MYWVTMKDTCLSGWGGADRKINIYQVLCDTLEQAEQIEKAGNERGEMENVRVHQSKPYFQKKRYLVTEKHFTDLGTIWTGGL